MLWILGLLVVLAVGFVVYRRLNAKPETTAEVVKVLEEVKNDAVAALDVNNDRHVSVEDVKEVAEVTKKAGKKAANKVKKAKTPKLKVTK